MTGKRPKNTDRVEVGYAYIAYNPVTGLYKIGSARRPLTRLSQLRSEMCGRVELVHTIATNHAKRLETEIQGRFLAQHLGGEWFQLSAADVESTFAVSSVWYRDKGQWVPRSRSRVDFDSGAAWAKKLPVCGAVNN